MTRKGMGFAFAAMAVALALVSCASYMPSGREDGRIYKIDMSFDESKPYEVLGEVVYSTTKGTGAFIRKALEMYPSADALIDSYIDTVYSRGWFGLSYSGTLYRAVAVRQMQGIGAL